MTDNGKYREVIFYKRYYLDFFEAQTAQIKKKINWTIGLIEQIDRVPESYLKHMEGTKDLYEMRVDMGGDAIRIFCFFDKGKLVSSKRLS